MEHHKRFPPGCIPGSLPCPVRRSPGTGLVGWHYGQMTTDPLPGGTPRRAVAADAAVVAQLLHDFNTEFATPTPGPEVLAARLEHLLAGDDVVAVLGGEPAGGLAVVTLRPNVWYDGPVALLDELYVRPELRNQRLGSSLLDAVIDLVRVRHGELIEVNVDGDDTDARRFYEARGFSNTEPHRTDPLLYYYREL
jgi:GNAT superfamily N-acetyltransferase